MLGWISNFCRWIWRDPRRRLYFVVWIFTLGPVSYGALVNLAYQVYYVQGAQWPPIVAHVMNLHLQVVSTEFYEALTIGTLSLGLPLLYFGIPSIPLRQRRGISRPTGLPPAESIDVAHSVHAEQNQT